MKKADLIREIVPAKIAYWKDASPEYCHDGKEEELYKIYSRYTKEMLLMQYNSLKEKGYIK